MNNGPSSEFKQNMGDKLRKSRERIDELRAETQAKARRAVRVTNNYAHDHPWRIAATSAAFGLIIGLLMKSTPRPRKIILRQPKPVINVTAPKVEKKHSGLHTLQGLIPLVLMGLKMYSASRPKNKIEPHDVNVANAPTPVP